MPAIARAHRSPNATDQLLHSGARVAAVLAPLIMVVAWLAERYLIGRPATGGRPQPGGGRRRLQGIVGPPARRAPAWPRCCLLIASQCGYFLTLEHSPLRWIAAPGTLLGFAGAFVIFRYWRNAAWQVRRGSSFDDGSRSGGVGPAA